MKYDKLFSEQELEAIEEMAAHGFIASEIAEVIIKPSECCENITGLAIQNPESAAYKAYRKGFLKSQLELRQRIFIDAKHGSSPAQALALKILDEADYNLHS